MILLKHFLSIFLIVLIIIASFSFSAFALTYDVDFPRPVPSEGTKYFLIGANLIMFQCADFYLVSPAHNNADETNQNITDALNIYVSYSNTDRKRLHFLITVGDSVYSSTSIQVYLFATRTGNCYAHYSVQLSNGIGSFNWEPTNFTMEDYYSFGVNLESSFYDSGLSLGDYRFSDTIDYSSDFTRLQDLLTNIYSDLNAIIAQDSSYYDSISEFLNQFFLTDYEDADVEYSNNWSYYLERFNNYTYNSNQFYRNFNDWYHDYFNPFADANLSKLDSIIMLLTGGLDSPTYESEEASEFQDSVLEHNELESQFMQDKSSDLGNLNDSINGSSGVFSSNNSNAFRFIQLCLEDYVTGNNYIGPLIIFSIAMGLVVLIIGRKIHA